jgi:hypothetical protein
VQADGGSAPNPVIEAPSPAARKMVYRGGCVAEYAEYLERSASTYDEQIGVAWPQGAGKERWRWRFLWVLMPSLPLATPFRG